MVGITYRFVEEGPGVKVSLEVIAENATPKEQALTGQIHALMEKFSHGLGGKDPNDKQVFFVKADTPEDLKQGLEYWRSRARMF